MKFRRELLRRFDVLDPAGLGEIVVAGQSSQEFALQMNDGITLSQERGFERRREGALSCAGLSG